MNSGIRMSVAVALLLGTLGCADQAAETTHQDDHHSHDHHDHDHGEAGVIEAPVAPSEEGEQFVLAEAPDDPQNVIEVRESSQDEEDVTLVGRIGGSGNPWIEGRAIFTLVDESLQSCNQIPGDQCPVPWDYCCETDRLPKATALVKVVDESGDTVATDARELLGVRELTEVVVQGKAKRDDAGNLTVLASKVFVKRQEGQESRDKSPEHEHDHGHEE